MKKANLLKLGLATVLATSAGIASADTADGQAAANLVAPLTVTEDGTQTMDFGTMAPAKLGGGETRVRLSAAATTTRNLVSGNGSLMGGTPASGKFNITGATGYAVDISVADGAADLSNGVGTLIFEAPTVSAATHTIAGVAATDVVYVGGDLRIPENADTSAAYTSATAYVVTVTYQ